MIIKRGDIVIAEVHHEDSNLNTKIRPVVVVSNDGQNEYSSFVQVCLITTTSPRKPRKSQFPLDKKLYDLKQDSIVDASQVMTVNKSGIKKKISRLTQSDMSRLDTALMNQFGVLSLNETVVSQKVGQKSANESAKKLKVYKDCNIVGSSQALEVLHKQLTLTVESSNDWTIDNNAKFSDFIIFRKTATEQAPGALLFLSLGDEMYQISNIVPTEKSSLTYDEYNELVDTFIRQFISPLVQRLRLPITISQSESVVSIEDYVSADVARRLRTFSSAANKATGTSHPLDKERWFSFITLSFRRNQIIDTDILQRWFVEEEGWPENKATELVIAYEESISLLRYYIEIDANG